MIGNSFDETIENYKIFIKELYLNYNNVIENLDDDKKERWENYRKGNINEFELIGSIRFLYCCLKKSLNQKIILLIII